MNEKDEEWESNKKIEKLVRKYDYDREILKKKVRVWYYKAEWECKRTN